MTAAMAKTRDCLTRYCCLEPLKDQNIPVEYTEDGKPVVYKRRWYILVAFCLSYFTWNFHSYRTTALISEFALYFDQPNEFQGYPKLGIDFMLIFESFSLLLFYPLGGMLVDKYGIIMMMYGSIGQAVATWWWFLSFEAYFSVLVSKVLSNIAGACIASSLLKISTNWFPETERAMAVAFSTLFANLGAGASIIVAPLFSVGDDLVNFDLISCREEDLQLDLSNLTALPIKCNDLAEEAFCCAAETHIDGLNLFMALFASAVALYTFIVTKEAPPTPPSKSGAVRKGPPFVKAMKLMFSHWNYCQICLTDFVSSGPPLVLFTTVDRIFPPSVSDYSTFSAAGAFLVAIPVGFYFSKQLAKTQAFYEYTAAGYTFGFLAWLVATIFFFVDTEATDYLFIIVGGAAIVAYVVWTVSVYELKMEYVFSSEYAIQGYIVAVDRTIINLSASLFLLAIPPERYKGDVMNGRQFTFVVGAAFMLFGTILALTIPNKRRYLRKQYEEENGSTDATMIDEKGK